MIPVRAIRDSRYRFVFFTAKCAGTTHDSFAFSVSSYVKRLAAGDLPNEFWIAADDAYVCTETMITPLSLHESHPGTSGDTFNFYQSSPRMHVEQTFGLLIAQWVLLHAAPPVRK